MRHMPRSRDGRKSTLKARAVPQTNGAEVSATCPECRALLHRYVEEELDALRSRRIRAHLEECESCRRTREALLAERIRLIELAVAAPPLSDRFASKVLRRVRVLEERRKRRKRLRALQVGLGFAAAAVLACVWIAGHLLSSKPPGTPHPAAVAGGPSEEVPPSTETAFPRVAPGAGSGVTATPAAVHSASSAVPGVRRSRPASVRSAIAGESPAYDDLPVDVLPGEESVVACSAVDEPDRHWEAVPQYARGHALAEGELKASYGAEPWATSDAPIGPHRPATPGLIIRIGDLLRSRRQTPSGMPPHLQLLIDCFSSLAPDGPDPADLALLCREVFLVGSGPVASVHGESTLEKEDCLEPCIGA